MAGHEVSIETVWPLCGELGCRGAAPAVGDRCLAHLGEDLLAGRLGPGCLVDARGAVIGSELLRGILAAAATADGGSRRLRVARFDGTVFEDDVSFDGVIFDGAVSFDGATFGRHGRFGEVQFRAGVSFVAVQFRGQAWFAGAVFEGEGSFAGTQFEGPAWFSDARFEGDARFDGAEFGRDAVFARARFAAQATFAGAVFGAGTGFEGATFACAPRFDEVVFLGKGKPPPGASGDIKPVPGTVESAEPASTAAPEAGRRGGARPSVLRRVAMWLGEGIKRRGVALGVLAFLMVGAWIIVRPGGGARSYHAAPVTLGQASAYAFLLTDEKTGAPVRYNPCQPIHYVVNPAHGPSNGRDEVHNAVAMVSDATGIQFIDDGVTDEPLTFDIRGEAGLPPLAPLTAPDVYRMLFGRPAQQPGRYGPDRWAPVLFAWVPTADKFFLGLGDSEGRDAAGVSEYVSGTVVVGASTPPKFLRSVLMHELGHVVGLAHVTEREQFPYQVMAPEDSFSGLVRWGPGDLAGLARLGRSAGCLPDSHP